MTKFQLFCEFCNLYKVLKANHAATSELDKFLENKGVYELNYYFFNYNSVFNSISNKLSIRDINECMRMIGVQDTREVTFNKQASKGVQIDLNPSHLAKEIKFIDHETKFGHEPYDYKKDGSFKKGREEEHSYTESVEKIVKCEEVAINGNVIGYVRTDNKTFCNSRIVYNENGKPVLMAYYTPTGKYVFNYGFSVRKNYINGKWELEHQYYGNRTLCPGWICDEKNNPKYLIEFTKDNAEIAYAENLYHSQDPWYSRKPYEYFVNEFKEKYSNLPVIDLNYHYND